MQFKDERKNDIEPFSYSSVDRPWGYYVNYANNIPCTVKILWVKKGEGLSLQFHFQRDQLYVLLDDGFTITDGEDVIENAKEGMTFGFPREHVHRAEYFGNKQYGRVLDVAFGKNLEEDIIRVLDRYHRGNGKLVQGDKNE